MTTPEQIGAKFNREWLAQRDTAKANYTTAAATIPDRLIAAKARMLANFTTAINGGALERGIQPYRANSRLADLYSQSVDAITAIPQAKLNKVVRDVQLKRALAANVGACITILKGAASGERTVPTGLSDEALAPLVVQAINKNQNTLSSTSTAAQIVAAIDAALAALGFPNKA